MLLNAVLRLARRAQKQRRDAIERAAHTGWVAVAAEVDDLAWAGRRSPRIAHDEPVRGATLGQRRTSRAPISPVAPVTPIMHRIYIAA